MKERLIKTDANGKITEVVKIVEINSSGNRLTGTIIGLSLVSSAILLLIEIKKLF